MADDHKVILMFIVMKRNVLRKLNFNFPEEIKLINTRGNMFSLKSRTVNHTKAFSKLHKCVDDLFLVFIW